MCASLVSATRGRETLDNFRLCPVKKNVLFRRNLNVGVAVLRKEGKVEEEKGRGVDGIYRSMFQTCVSVVLS